MTRIIKTRPFDGSDNSLLAAYSQMYAGAEGGWEKVAVLSRLVLSYRGLDADEVEYGLGNYKSSGRDAILKGGKFLHWTTIDPTLPHEVNVPMARVTIQPNSISARGGPLNNTVVEWCNDNIGTRDKDWVYWGHMTVDGQSLAVFIFKDERKALLFKMRWS